MEIIMSGEQKSETDQQQFWQMAIETWLSGGMSVGRDLPVRILPKNVQKSIFKACKEWKDRARRSWARISRVPAVLFGKSIEGG